MALGYLPLLPFLLFLQNLNLWLNHFSKQAENCTLCQGEFSASLVLEQLGTGPTDHLSWWKKSLFLSIAHSWMDSGYHEAAAFPF